MKSTGVKWGLIEEKKLNVDIQYSNKVKLDNKLRKSYLKFFAVVGVEFMEAGCGSLALSLLLAQCIS